MGLREQAHAAVAKAVKSGELIRESCEECGELDAEAHHDDYSMPLDVRWLCPKHHRQVHVRVGKLSDSTDIHIRNVDDAHYKALKVRATEEGITLKQLALRLLGFTEPKKISTDI